KSCARYFLFTQNRLRWLPVKIQISKRLMT
ncbi:TRAP transporter solute receptor, TAXI family protein, partial [Vibrio parahaemolyticus V-223/04]